MPQSTANVIPQLEKALLGFQGARYLAALCVGLTKGLGSRYAFVSRRKEGQPHFGETVVMAENGQNAKPMLYDLRMAPCRSVFGGQSLTIPCNLIDLYPGQVGMDAYCGVPLLAPDGDVLGVLAVVSDKPLIEVEALKVLNAFASKCATELSHIET